MKKAIFIILILVLTGYSLYLLAIPHYNHFAFKSDSEEILRIIIAQDPIKTKKKIMEIAVQYDIPITEEDVHLTWDRRYSLKVSWMATVNWFGVYQKTFNFDVDTANLLKK